MFEQIRSVNGVAKIFSIHPRVAAFFATIPLALSHSVPSAPTFQSDI